MINVNNRDVIHTSATVEATVEVDVRFDAGVGVGVGIFNVDVEVFANIDKDVPPPTISLFRRIIAQ